jgi:hypothetical protein
MKKSILVSELMDIEKDLDIELLIQTKIDNDYFNITTTDIISVDDDDSTIIIRANNE